MFETEGQKKLRYYLIEKIISEEDSVQTIQGVVLKKSFGNKNWKRPGHFLDGAIEN